MEKAGLMVYMRSEKKNYNATGRFDGNGITVLKGSLICTDWGYFSKALLEKRRHYVDNDYVLMEDLYFPSPSQASTFVCGRSSNGWTMWRFENGDELARFRENGAIVLQKIEDKSKQLLTDEQEDDGIRITIGQILSQIQHRCPEVTFVNKKIHTSIYLYGECIAIVYYRKREIRMEVRKNNSMYQLYDRLLLQNLVYQKPTADSNSVPGKFSFFMRVNSVESVLWALIDHQRVLKKEQKYSAETKSGIAEAVQVHIGDEIQRNFPEENRVNSIENNAVDSKYVQHNTLGIERIASENGKRSMQQKAALYEKPSEDERITELFRQVAQLQEIVLRQKNVHTIDEDAERRQSVGDNRYRIAMSRVDSPEFFVRDCEKPIQNLTFSVNFFSKENGEKTSGFQAFFIDEQYDVVSNMAEFNMGSGQAINCRFTLKSKMSGKKVCYLGIRDSRDMHDELLKLIPFRIEILFKADFDF